MAYRNDSQNNGFDTRTMDVYGYSFPILAGKTLESITLPANADIKILAMDLVFQPKSSGLANGSNLAGSTGTTSVASNTGTTAGETVGASGSETTTTTASSEPTTTTQKPPAERKGRSARSAPRKAVPTHLPRQKVQEGRRRTIRVATDRGKPAVDAENGIR